MTERDEWLALAERCEKATGADREIDAEIMFDAFAVPAGDRGYLWPKDNPSWNFGIRFPDRTREQILNSRRMLKTETIIIDRDNARVLMNALRIPPITSSIDAIVALIERELSPDHDVRLDFAAPSSAVIWQINSTNETKAKAATPALALCAAFCRAMAESDKAEMLEEAREAMKKLPRILICGGHYFNDHKMLSNALDELCESRGWITSPSDDGHFLPLVNVFCIGTGRILDLVDQWTITNWLNLKIYTPNFPAYGETAWNRAWFSLYNDPPDIVVIFPGLGEEEARLIRWAEREKVEVLCLPTKEISE